MIATDPYYYIHNYPEIFAPIMDEIYRLMVEALMLEYELIRLGGA